MLSQKKSKLYLKFRWENVLQSFYTGHKNIWTNSGPVDQPRFLPDDVILNFVHVKFIKKLSNGLIDIHLIVPLNVLILCQKKSKLYCLVNFKAERRSTVL
jgi:hypothetical protein